MLDELHGAAFGGAGDGAAGEEGAEDVIEGGVGEESAGDGGSHLEKGLVFFDGEEVVSADGAGLGDFSEVVAEEIDDHDVFGAVFGVVMEPIDELRVFGEGAAAGCGAFHGAGGDAVVVDAEEKFWRKGENVVMREMEEGGEGDFLLIAQVGEKSGGRAGEVEERGSGEIELVSVAGGDEVADGFDFFAIGGLGDGEMMAGDGEGGGGGRGLRKLGRKGGGECAGGVVEDEGVLVDAEPGERKRGESGWAESGGGFEMEAALVGEEAGDEEALGEGVFDGLEEGGNVAEGLRREDAEGMEEEIAAGVFGVGAGRFQEEGTRQGGEDGVELLRKADHGLRSV